MTLPKRVPIIGVPISAVNEDSCVSFIQENFDEIRGQYICVANVHTTVMAHDSPSYIKVQSESILTVPDGKPLSWLGKKQAPDVGQVTGTFLMRHFLLNPQQNPYRHFFYGNTGENLSILTTRLQAANPNIVIAGALPSLFRELGNDELDDLVQSINETNPDFVWVGLGAPRQEMLCAKLKNRVGGLMIGVGGAFNVVAGIVPDAPSWMKKLGLEWFYRLLKEPRRLFKRYFVTNTKFIIYLLKARCSPSIKRETT